MITRPLNKVQKQVFVNDIIADMTCRLLFGEEKLNNCETGNINSKDLNSHIPNLDSGLLRLDTTSTVIAFKPYCGHNMSSRLKLFELICPVGE
jgi:hypothetical protein